MKINLSDKTQKTIILTVNFIIAVLMVLVMVFYLNTVEWYLKALAYSAITIFTVACTVFAILNKKSLYRTMFVGNVVTFIFVAIFFLLNRLGVFDSLNDLEKVKQMILDWGAYGYVIFVLLQLLQVIVLPAPGFIFYLAGTAIYGPWLAFILSYISVIVGSIIAFYIGRLCGKPVVYWCVGKQQTEKYLDIIGGKGNVLFIIMQLLPFFPDDILCMIAGLTKMSFTFFILVMVFVRPIYILIVCFLGTGDIIPFSGWGIPVWIGIILILAVLFFLYCKYQQKIEEKITSIFSKKKDKEDKKG